ncbi:hypothetical protein [Pseudomonas sp. Q1]|uniref:hypothetical protein n=1 Tax=Pseudomonas sp. Q1 TaxID=2202823 RepID=UPI0013749FA0|nr:hypothetical protein [Pseudomonas sp. Q1]NCE87666.1 hypothetical protein [Pseudomonas sp. Q1]
MTIFFVTNSDRQTKANLAVASKIVIETDIRLFDRDALRIKLHEQLNGKKRTIFSMSHGSESAIIDSVGDKAIFEADGHALNGFKVFAWACLSAKGLGESLAKQNVYWWGYDAAITAPDDRERYINIYAEILFSVKSNFERGIDDASVTNILNTIRDVCLAAEEKLDMAGAGEDDEAMSLYSCCRQIWTCLCIWLPQNQQPIKHNDAPAAFIEF